MEPTKYRPLTMAELQADIELISQSGMESTRKKALAQKKWLNTQSSAKKTSHFVPRIQVTNGSPSDKNIIRQFRVLSVAEMQADIDLLPGRKNPGSARKSVNPRSRTAHCSANYDKSGSPSDKNITSQFRVLSVAEMQADIDLLFGRKNPGSARKSINPRSRPAHFSAKYDKSDTKSKFYSNRVHSATIPKAIRRSVGKSGITSKRDVGTGHSKIRKALTFGPEISKIPQIRKDKCSSSSSLSTNSTEIRDLKTMNSNQMTKCKLSKLQSEKLCSPSVNGLLNMKSLPRTISEFSRMSGVNFCPQSPMVLNVAQTAMSNNQNNQIMIKNKGIQLANPDLSRISESPSILRLSKANTTSNSDESFLAREKEIFHNSNEEIDEDNNGEDFRLENQNVGKDLDISFDGDDTLCFENSVIHKPDTTDGNTDYKNVHVEHKINLLCDQLKKTSNKAAVTAHKQHEHILQFKSKLETQRRILLRQNKQLQYLLNSNKEMLDAINDIVGHGVEDETIVMDEADKSPKPEGNAARISISDTTTPPSSKRRSINRRNSPVFVIPKKTSCLRKKILSKSFGAESHVTLMDGQADNKPREMYMKMKESWNFLQTPNKPNFNINAHNLTQSSPFISFCLQRQLDKLYGKETSQS